jgi:hypothetical protein
MKNHDHTNDPLDTTEQVNHPMRELLPEYATMATLGNGPEKMYPPIAAHLKICAACRAEFAELLSLTTDMYTGQVTVAPHYPPVDLSFLGQPTTAAPAQCRPWLIDALDRLIVVFSEQLLESLRRPTLAGALRGQLLYRYVQEAGSLHDLDVKIEAFVEDAASGLGRVRVDVDVPSRGPFDQRGNQVVLRADDSIWQDETDELGLVDFAPFPLGSLPRLRVEITPLRNTH